jgi:DNA-binding SARP family transcriptional activator/ABC-type branched-subunit amino acid transport system substrate-binding protein/DNA-binding beta-propeller fold protein YncE
LLIHANEIVSSDRLVEELWSEAPPASALKTLQALVSRLRSALGPASGSLLTHGHGYRLQLEPAQLDAEAFRDGLDEGRRALARGDAAAASETLRDALALWRGPALAEFRYADFAQSEIARLEELRLAAQEERIEADLELGRHEELVVELEELVSDHPLRERLRAQLMLALYRSGRQAEALQTYQEGRRALAEELGLEPSESVQRLERQILEHDPALAPPTGDRPSYVPGAVWRHPRRVAIAGALLLALAVGSAFYAGSREDASPRQSAGASALDSASGDLQEQVSLGTSPSQVTIGEGFVWVLDADDKTVSQIDPETREVVRTFSTSSTPTDIAAGAGALWIGNAGESGGVLPESVSRIDPESGDLEATVEVARFKRGHLYGGFAGLSGRRLAVAPDAVWVIGADGKIVRIEPSSNERVATIDKVKPQNIATGEGMVWVSEEQHLVQIDPVRNIVARRIPVEASPFGPLAIGAGSVWFADPENGQVFRVSTQGKPRQTAIELDQWVSGVAFGEGAAWAVNEVGDAIYRIDPRGGEPTRTGAHSPRAVAAGDGVVWATTSAPPSRDAALPESVCREVFFGRDGEPDLLLVSDLNLKGDSRQWGQAMVDGMRYTLERRGFEAGAFSVGYQSCDSSTAQASGPDFFRCASNAKAYARNLRVTAVFGAFNSPCSYAQIPITNEAEDGPLAMLSPSNTYEGLTLDDALYPTGTRSYFRIAAPNFNEAAAHIELARQLGHDRVYLLTSEWDEYGEIFVDTARTAARRAGIDIVGYSVFDHEADDYTGLIEDVEKRRPEAVMVSALLSEGAGKLVRGLHAALGPEVPLIAPDGFRLIDDVVALVGSATDALYVTEYGVPNAKLPPRGQQFLEGFAAAHGGDPGPDLAASYGAQGAELLLDAIARSDGSRASVLAEIRTTRIQDGILGDIAFDRNGDRRERPIGVYRVENGAFVADRVIVVRAPRPGGP